MKKRTDITQLMALSLFILILAFFIVLNSLSDFREERVIPVLASLEAAFASRILGQGEMPSAVESETALELFSGSALDDLEVALRNSFDLLSISRPSEGREMSVSLNKDTFLSAARTPDQIGFQNFKEKMLRVLLATEESVAQYTLTLVVETEETGSYPIEQVYALMNAFARAGIDPEIIKIRLEHGNPEQMRFIFSPNLLGVRPPMDGDGNGAGEGN